VEKFKEAFYGNERQQTMCASFLYVPGSGGQQVLQYRMRSDGGDAGYRLPMRTSGLRR
jgi:hypothetical protein